MSVLGDEIYSLDVALFRSCVHACLTTLNTEISSCSNVDSIRAPVKKRICFSLRVCVCDVSSMASDNCCCVLFFAGADSYGRREGGGAI